MYAHLHKKSILFFVLNCSDSKLFPISRSCGIPKEDYRTIMTAKPGVMNMLCAKYDYKIDITVKQKEVQKLAEKLK